MLNPTVFGLLFARQRCKKVSGRSRELVSSGRETHEQMVAMFDAVIYMASSSRTSYPILPVAYFQAYQEVCCLTRISKYVMPKTQNIEVHMSA